MKRLGKDEGVLGSIKFAASMAVLAPVLGMPALVSVGTGYIASEAGQEMCAEAITFVAQRIGIAKVKPAKKKLHVEEVMMCDTGEATTWMQHRHDEM